MIYASNCRTSFVRRSVARAEVCGWGRRARALIAMEELVIRQVARRMKPLRDGMILGSLAREFRFSYCAIRYEIEAGRPGPDLVGICEHLEMIADPPPPRPSPDAFRMWIEADMRGKRPRPVWWPGAARNADA